MGDVLMSSKKEIQSLIQSGNSADLKSFVSKVLGGDSTKLQICRPLLLDLAMRLHDEILLCLADDPKLHIPEESLTDLLSFMTSSMASSTMRSQLDEVDAQCRESLFSYHITCGEYKIGASVLAEINLESPISRFTSEKKADILVRCAEAFLQEDESTSAETMLTRARVYMNQVEDSQFSGRSQSGASDEAASSVFLLKLRYRVIRAKVDDANRKFIEAARQYHELSSISNSSIPSHEKLELLGNAVTCAVLCKAGPQRSRVLGLLYKDDRIKDLESIPKFSSHASILVKMYTQRLLNTSELVTFEKFLKSHQKALTSDGYSIVEKAVIEHNMQAAGKIYENIVFPELGKLLRLTAAEAESVAAKMIGEKRLHACIDQTENILVFEGNVNDYSASIAPLQAWDERNWDICMDISECADLVATIENI